MAGPLMRGLLAGIIMAVAMSAAAWAQTVPFDAAHANAYFTEARQISDKEGGHLWGMKLYGPILFVDPTSRAVIANQQDARGRLHRDGEVFTGTLTADIEPSDTPIEWSGTRWTMLIWQLVPEDRLTREKTFAHEMFHRIQPALHLAAPDTPNLQLDTPEGRLWLELEWRALAAALVEHGAAREEAIRDALAFRAHRHAMFKGSAESERSLEIAEGVPEYTGVAAAAPDEASARWYTVARLSNPDMTISFVRSFAYVSGPGYGLLLDDMLPGWRAKLTAQSDLGELLASTVPQAEVSAQARAPAYGAAALQAAEEDRAAKIAATKARYRRLLVTGPTLTLAGAGHFNFTFNPSALISLGDEGAVYPTFHATDAWGTLDVTDGALLPTDFSKVTVTAPTKALGSHAEGPGWTLDLAAGWHIVEAPKPGSFAVQKR